MINNLPDTSVRVVSQGYDTWKVQVLFSNPELVAGEIPERLREIKTQLASQFGVPDGLLEYVRLASKRQTRNGLLVEMFINKLSVPAGAPLFRSLPLKTPDGTVFTDMVLDADLYPRDDFDRPLTRETIRDRLLQQGYDLSLIDWNVVDEAMRRMDSEGIPLENLRIGQGRLPEFGRDAALTYGVKAGQQGMLSSAWIGVRPVSRGDFLVEVSSAISGLRRGQNLKGRELEARNGVSTTIEEGEGTRLTSHESKLLAARDGLVVFERLGRDRRQKDQRHVVPSRLIGKVLPTVTFTVSEVFDLDLCDAAQIVATVQSGARIRTNQPLYIEGDVEEGAEIVGEDSVRVVGNVRKANISCKRHLAVVGTISESVVEAGLTVQVEGRVVNTTVYAMDIIADEIEGGFVEVLSQPRIGHVQDRGGEAAAIHVNLHKFLEHQQLEGRQAVEDLRESLNRLIGIFGPEVALQTTEGTIPTMLLKWLRNQKAAGISPYSYAEVKEFRALLELVPQIRERLTAAGMELREVTIQLHSAPPSPRTEIPNE